MLFENIVPVSIRGLKNLSVCLDKAAAYADAKKFEMSVLLNARLAPDQFHLIRQVQIASDVAKFGVARVTGKDAPTFEDNETTVEQLKTRIQKTITYLEQQSEKDFAGAENRRVTQPRWEGRTLSTSEFVHLWVLPNLYFHITMTYEILRHNGVPLGKADFLGELPYRNA